MMWKIEAYVAACDMTIKDNVLKMMLSHPPRGTKSKSKIVENDKILKKKWNWTQNYIYFLVSLNYKLIHVSLNSDICVKSTKMIF
jgi:hypothetical protein